MYLPFTRRIVILEQSWREVFQIATPCLPFMVGPERFIEDMFNFRLILNQHQAHAVALMSKF